MSAYTFAQTFFIDKSEVKNASTVQLTSVKLYFKRKPKRSGNRSGIVAPGVSISVCETDQTYAPDASRVIKGSAVRVTFDSINALTDASVGTAFTFDAPLSVSSDRFYAILIKFEDPDFEMWQNVQGDRLVGTNIPSPGATGKGDGKYYLFNNYSAPQPINSIDLKYQVNIARFTSNTISIDMVPKSQEFIKYRNHTKPFLAGEFVYQDFGGLANGELSSNVIFCAPGTINVISNSNIVTGTGTDFATGLLAADDYIVITDNTIGNTDVIRVSQIVSDTVLELEHPPSFTANSVYYKRTVVAKYFTLDKRAEEVVLVDSTANATAYFTNTSIFTVQITDGGEAYVNGDILTVHGGGATVNATATVTTNTTGGITHLRFSNVGLGFTTTPSTTIKNSIGGATTGFDGTFTYTIGNAIRSRSSQGRLFIKSIEDRSTKFIKPKLGLSMPASAKATYTVNFSNTGYYLDSNRDAKAENDQIKELDFDAVIASRSNEVLNGTNLFQDVKQKRRSGRIKVKIDLAESASSTQGVFNSPVIFDNKLELLAMRAIINNDTTGEDGRYGNAACKHITKRVTFGEGKSAEDLKVFMNAYRPANTDVKVYAKLHNSRDPEPFDDKSWTPLELESGVDQVSSSNNPSDMFEYTFGLTPYAESEYVLTGTVFVDGAGNTAIAGTNTAFLSELAVNDLIKIYDPLFPDNYDIVAVSAVTTNTAITLYSATTNPDLQNTAGLKADKIKYKHSAFNNIAGDNVSRYFSTTMVPYDKFDSYSLKIVLLSSDGISIPRVDDIRALGVSA